MCARPNWEHALWHAPSGPAMKPCPLAAALLLAAAVGSVGAVVVKGSHASALSRSSASSSAVARRFGPKHCVLIERSSTGSCTMRTDCHGQDTSSLEFAFDCWSSNGDIFRHSYGRGGFGEKEAFDTEVQCAQCHPPSEDIAKQPAKSEVPKVLPQTKTSQHPLMSSLHPAARAAATIAATEDKASNETRSTVPRVVGGMGDLASRKKADPAPAISRYGPKKCVSTWLNPQGHCIVQTACQEADISSYEFGLICRDSKGVKTRHVFGRGSFDVSETFDTLAECNECIGLDDERAVAFRAQKRHWQQSADASEVATLSEEVQTLTKGMTSMLGAVLKLRQKVEVEKMTTQAPSVVATLAAWSGEGSLDASGGSDAGAQATVPATKPRLRAAAAATATVAQVQEVKRKHRHRRRRVVEYEDDDDEDDGEEEKSRDVRLTKTEDAQKDDGEDAIANSDDGEGPTNGIGEVLTEDADAEGSELTVAEDGVASAGSLDDGTSSLEPAW